MPLTEEDWAMLVEHYPAEEWVGYPMTICGSCIVPWPCRWASGGDPEVTEDGGHG